MPAGLHLASVATSIAAFRAFHPVIRKTHPFRDHSTSLLNVFDPSRPHSGRLGSKTSILFYELRADFAQKLERIDPRFVSVAEIDLVGVVANRRHGGCSHRSSFFGLQNVEDGGRLSSFGPACGAWAAIAQCAPRYPMRGTVVPFDEECVVVAFERFEHEVLGAILHDAAHYTA